MRWFGFFALGFAATVTLSACAKSATSTANAAANAGRSVYQTNCASCHQADGKGLPGSFPPLAGNPLVTGDPKGVIHAVKYGVTGKISVHGQTFNGIMPPWGSQLSNKQVADVVTYIRSSWGNNAPAVTEAQAAAVAK